MTEATVLRNGRKKTRGGRARSQPSARLNYASDTAPGIRRRRRGKHFEYIRPDGQIVTDPADIERIAALAIPPAWEDVWISSDPNGHLQATGRDARGRKQYRYHAEWRRVRDNAKFDRMVDFGAALPKIRRRVEQDLHLRGMSHDKVIAAVVRLLDETLIRVGNDEYVRDNGSFGLTTLRERHVKVRGNNICFTFKGKSGKRHRIDLSDGQMARIVKRLHEIPGQELFQYIDENGERRRIGSADVNDYLRETSGGDFTAKDFRTWTATVLADAALRSAGPVTNKAEGKHLAAAIASCVAERLRNTPAVCRKAYIHPLVLESALNGARPEGSARSRKISGLSRDESETLALLSERERATSTGE